MGKYLTLLTYIVMFFLGCLSIVISKKIRNLFDKIIDWVLFELNLKVSLYKKRTREIYSILERYVTDEITPKADLPKFIFEEWDEHKKIPFEWKIIKVDKTLDKERIDKSIILQLPSSSRYKIERNLMNVQYKKAFFLSLSRKLALKMKKEDVVSCIDDEVQRMGILKEFQTMCEILTSKDKLNSMICEARRKWIFTKGEIGSSAKKEFCKFLEDLTKGIVGILTITSLKQTESYLVDVKSCLTKYNILHIYTRGLYPNYSFLKRMDELYALIKIKINKVIIQDQGVYDWKDSKGHILYKARTIIIKKK